MRLIFSACACLALIACTEDDDRIAFDGQYFKGRVSGSKEDRTQFVATVTPVAASLEGAREAARYEGTKYCIKNYGTSKIDWSSSPDAEEADLSIENGTLTVAGACDE
jgi:hypothetical protein